MDAAAAPGRAITRVSALEDEHERQRSLETRKILIVDDERLIRWSIGQKLASWGYEPIEAEDAATASRAFLRESPDLVLLDLRLPDRSGMDVLREIKGSTHSVPVIMMTASGTIDDAIAAARSGAHRFLTKPVSPDELQVALEEALDRHTFVPGENPETPRLH